MDKQTMKSVLKSIQSAAVESSLTGAGADGDIVFILTYNKLRQLAIDNGWIEADLVIELRLDNNARIDPGLFGKEREVTDIVGAAATIFAAALGN